MLENGLNRRSLWEKEPRHIEQVYDSKVVAKESHYHLWHKGKLCSECSMDLISKMKILADITFWFLFRVGTRATEGVTLQDIPNGI